VKRDYEEIEVIFTKFTIESVMTSSDIDENGGFAGGDEYTF
jgi:hypothetical protein